MIIGTFDGIIILLFGIGINVFGLYVRRNPTFTWQASESWKTKGDGEPSDAYIRLHALQRGSCPMDRILRYGNGDIEPVIALPYNGAASSDISCLIE